MIYSQSSLQDYSDCKRRFELRYVQRLAWPAIESDPVLENEKRMFQGQRFHRLIQQALIGLPVESLEGQLGDGDLPGWWSRFQAARSEGGLGEIDSAGSRRYLEVSLSAGLRNRRLVAQFDLLLVKADGSLVIYDWKTNRKRPKAEWLAMRLQTRLYPYLLVRAGAQFNRGAPVEPERVEMVYWFSDFPDQPERFAYHAAAFQADEAYLSSLLDDLAGRGAGDYFLTDDERQCRFCVYRSLCARGRKAGVWDDSEELGETSDPSRVDFDFEQIGEIEF